MLIFLIILHYIIAFVGMILSIYYLNKITNDNTIFGWSFIIILDLCIFCFPGINIWCFYAMAYDWKKEYKTIEREMSEKVMNKLIGEE